MLLLACSLTPEHVASAAEPYWNEFRGPGGRGVSSEKNLPLRFGEDTHVRWKTPLKGRAWSSPVVWDRQIWFTNATKDGKKMYAVCADIDSGKIVHNMLIFENEKLRFCHALNSFATPTPVVEKGRVYVHFGEYGTACLDTATGKPLWMRRDLKCDHYRGPASSPIMYGNLLIIAFDGFDVQYVVALDRRDGSTVWKKNRAFDYRTNNGDLKKAYCTPLLVEQGGIKQLICPAAVATEARDPDTGRLLWTVRHAGMNASARPQYAAGLVFITNGMGSMVAVRPGGKGDVTRDRIAWNSRKSVPKKSSLLTIGELLFMMSDSGVASCVEAKTGEVIWSKRLGKGKYAASPISVPGRIYFFSQEGEIPVIKPGREFKLLATNKLDAGFMATPAVADGALILRTKTHLYKVKMTKAE